MENNLNKVKHINDVFISYSRKDRAFAAELQKALENYSPPRNLKVAQRKLAVFRDESDFTGIEYHESLDKHLRGSAKMIVICSPNARKSKYVNDEILRFSKISNAHNIIPVLISGIPNNEAMPEQDKDMAFPDALLEKLELPIAANYTGFKPAHDKISKGVFYGPWYTILANIYGIGRSEIEQRDKKRQARRRNAIMGVVSSIIAVLSVALIFAVMSRNIAEKRRQIALSRQLTAQAVNLSSLQPDLALLLSIEAQNINKSVEATGGLIASLESNPHLSGYLREHRQSVNSLAFSPDGKILASGSSDQTIILWDVEKHQKRRILEGHSGEITSLAFAPDSDGRLLASGSKDSTIILWDVENGEKLGQLIKSRESGILAIAFRPDSRILAAGSSDGNIDLWDISTNKLLFSLKNKKNNPVTSLSFDQNGNILASISKEGTITLWDVDKQHPNDDPIDNGRNLSANAIAFSPNDLILAAAINNVITLWDKPNLKRIGHPLITPVNPYNIIFSPDGKKLISGGMTGGMYTVMIWDVGDSRSSSKPYSTDMSLRGHLDTVESVAISSDGNILASGSSDGIIILWDLARQHHFGKVFKGVDAQRVKFAPDGKIIAMVTYDESVKLWDVDKMEFLDGALSGISVAFSPDNRSLATGYNEGKIILRDVRAQQPVGQFSTGKDHYLYDLTFDAGGKNLAAADNKGIIFIWDLANSKSMKALPTMHVSINSLVYNPVSNMLAVAGNDNHVILWDLDEEPPNRRMLEAPIKRNKILTRVAFNEDGSILASGSQDNHVIVWDMQEVPLRPRKLIGHADHVADVVFSPNGKILASAGSDNTVKLWSTKTKGLIGSLKTGERVTGIDISPDGTTLVSVSSAYDDNLIFWDLDVKTWRQTACRVSNRNLSCDEWQQYLDGEPYRATCPEKPSPGKCD